MCTTYGMVILCSRLEGKFSMSNLWADFMNAGFMTCISRDDSEFMFFFMVTSSEVNEHIDCLYPLFIIRNNQ